MQATTEVSDEDFNGLVAEMINGWVEPQDAKWFSCSQRFHIEQTWNSPLCLEIKSPLLFFWGIRKRFLRLVIPGCLPWFCEGLAYTLTLLSLWLRELRPSSTAQSVTVTVIHGTGRAKYSGWELLIQIIILIYITLPITTIFCSCLESTGLGFFYWWFKYYL